MVSAAKLRKAQDAIIMIHPYGEKLSELLSNIKIQVNKTLDPYTEKRSEEKILIVLVTSNRGLCGAFNLNSAKKAIELVNDKFKEQFERENVDIACIGKKGADYLKNKGYKIHSLDQELTEKVTFEKAFKFSESLMSEYSEGNYDRIELIFNRFKNAAVQRLSVETFLPLSLHVNEDEEKEENKPESEEYIFEPSIDYIIQELIPLFLKTQFYQVLLEASASEHGARMTAMHKASDNADKITRELKLNYNKARQSLITNELIEIVSGADALGKA